MEETNTKLKYIKGLIGGETDTELVSSSKFWFNIANLAITITYILLGYAVAKMQNPLIADFAWLTLVYAGVVATNKFANKFLEYKYGSKYTETTSSESKTVIKGDKT